jgi:hypothetical protein
MVRKRPGMSDLDAVLHPDLGVRVNWRRGKQAASSCSGSLLPESIQPDSMRGRCLTESLAPRSTGNDRRTAPVPIAWRRGTAGCVPGVTHESRSRRRAGHPARFLTCAKSRRSATSCNFARLAAKKRSTNRHFRGFLVPDFRLLLIAPFEIVQITSPSSRGGHAMPHLPAPQCPSSQSIGPRTTTRAPSSGPRTIPGRKTARDSKDY